MKKLILFFVVFFLFASVKAQPPQIDAQPGMVFGKEFITDEAMDINTMGTILVNDKPQHVIVSGIVTTVCKSEGCWLKLGTENGGSVLVKMKDHSFLVPVSLEGKSVILSGMGKRQETSVEMLQHYAEDAGKSKEEIAAIKEPKQEIILVAEGVIVK